MAPSPWARSMRCSKTAASVSRDCAEALSHSNCYQLFVCTTKVRSGKVRIFGKSGINANALLGSACLPQVFKAVEIEGEAYWDCGYMGNSAFYPLFYHTHSADIVVVHINPIKRDDVPRTPAEIANRINEISFHSFLLQEMRAISFAARLVDEAWLKEEYRGRGRHMLMHSIRDDKVMAELSIASKFNPETARPWSGCATWTAMWHATGCHVITATSACATASISASNSSDATGSIHRRQHDRVIGADHVFRRRAAISRVAPERIDVFTARLILRPDRE